MDNVRPFQLKIQDVPGVITPTQTTVKLPIHPHDNRDSEDGTDKHPLGGNTSGLFNVCSQQKWDS